MKLQRFASLVNNIKTKFYTVMNQAQYSQHLLGS